MSLVAELLLDAEWYRKFVYLANIILFCNYINFYLHNTITDMFTLWNNPDAFKKK